MRRSMLFPLALMIIFAAACSGSPTESSVGGPQGSGAGGFSASTGANDDGGQLGSSGGRTDGGGQGAGSGG